MITGDREVRWGILGAGGIAETVGTDIAASPGSVLTAVGARDGQRAQAFAERNGVRRSYGSYVELVSDPDVDVIYVATTHAQHHEHALLALSAGKPVLVEKAFTLNAAQAVQVVEAARGRRLFCMEAMWMRFNPLIVALQQLVADGQIGELISVRADLSRHFAYDPKNRLFDLEAGGGALLDLGIYPATLVWLLLGAPDQVTATGTLAPTGSDASVAIQCSYPTGPLAQIYTSAVGDSPFAALVCGTRGWIRVETSVHRPTALTVHSADGDRVIEAGEQSGNGYGRQVAEVERCLRAGAVESPTVPLDETIAILAMMDDVRRQVGVRYPADEE